MPAKITSFLITPASVRVPPRRVVLNPAFDPGHRAGTRFSFFRWVVLPLLALALALTGSASLGASTAKASSLWEEDWASHNVPNPANPAQVPSSYWNFHTYNLYKDPHTGLPPATDTYTLIPNLPNGNILRMSGSGWGLESKQHFSQGAPISVESIVQMDPLTADTSTLAEITVYDGETGHYEGISLEDHSGGTTGLAVYRRTESTGYPLPGTGTFFNSALNHNHHFKLRLDFDGRGNWSYYAWDLDDGGKGGLLATVPNRYQDSAPNIFILGVALAGSDATGLVQYPGDARYLCHADFQKITVHASYNLFSETSWVDFLDTSQTQNPNNMATSQNSYYHTDTNDPTCNGHPGNCWYAQPDLPWPQDDFIQLAHTTPPNPPDPSYFTNPYYTSGYIQTPAITLPNPNLNWGEVLFSYSLGGAGTDLNIQVTDAAGNLLPDSVLPGNSSGFRSSPIRMGGLDTAAYPALRLKANMSTTNPGIPGSPGLTPKLFDWTLTFGKKSYFSWYDMQSPGMRDWLLMSNAAIYSTSSHFQTELGTPGVGPSTYNVASPNTSAIQTFPGMMDGPLMVNNLTGLPQVISQRILFGNSMEETVSVPQDRLADRYYWTWYDMQTPGYKNWVLVANPDYSNSVYYEIRMPGVDPNTTPGAKGTIPPGGRVTPMFPGVMGGPVTVQAWTSSSKLTGAKIIATQRVLMFGDTAFNEVNGIPQGTACSTDPSLPECGLKSDYLWTWYDMQSTEARNWVLVANPNSTLVGYQISIAGGCTDGDPSRCQTGTLQPAGDIAGRDRVIPTFPGQMGGPVEVTSTGGNVIASQRTLWSQSFEEVPGFAQTGLESSYHWTWYDQQSAGSRNWVLVANPGGGSVYYEIKIGGILRSNGTIMPGGRVIPTFAGIMGGPVQVQAWTDASRTTPANVFASQRVLWSNHMNEVLGTVLDS